MKGNKNIKKQIKLSILIFVRWLTGIAKWIRIGSTRKQVLFVAESQLMISYLSKIWNRLQYDDRLSIWVAFDDGIEKQVIATAISSFCSHGNRIRCINYRAAMIWPWDLIFFADCTTAWKSFARTSLKIHTQHGLPAGKLSRSGKEVIWAEWLYKEDGKPAFDMLLVSSDSAKLKGERLCPSYIGKIASVGDLRFDNLLNACSHQGRLKKKFGISDRKKVVLVTSSWGPKSLLHTVGERLYQECSKLADEYQFIISVHPNNYDRDKRWIGIIQQQMNWGAIVIQPADDWVPFLAVSDVLITDYTSMSLYFIPLLRPIVSIDIPDDFGAPESAMYRMEKIATRLPSPEKLKDALEIAFSTEIVENHQEFAREIVSYQGQAWIETGRRIYDLLSMSVPNHDQNKLSDK